MTHIEILQMLYDSSYICSRCGKRIYPIIKEVSINPPELTIENDQTWITGRHGKKLSGHICPECTKRMNDYVTCATDLHMALMNLR